MRMNESLSVRFPFFFLDSTRRLFLATPARVVSLAYVSLGTVACLSTCVKHDRRLLRNFSPHTLWTLHHPFGISVTYSF
jgi:hypothetical protein